MKPSESRPRVTVPTVRESKSSRNKSRQPLTALAAYDYTFARLLDAAEIDIILVGDSLASIVQGLPNTLPVTLDEMIYHSRAVSRGVEKALVVGDLPFMSYQLSLEQALESAGRMIKEGGVAGVKLEGGIFMEETIARLVQVDIPVMGHVGLTPQSYHRMGGHRIQGRTSATDSGEAGAAGSRERVIEDAMAVERAGAFAVVLEGIPSELAAEITSLLEIPTIGIGAGPSCDGQVLVAHDLLGFTGERTPSFVKKYADLGETIVKSAAAFRDEVRKGIFPDESHSFSGDKSRLRRVMG